MTVETHVISPAQIHETLNKIWESFETTNVTRASLFNLIFYTKSNGRTPYVKKLAQKVVEKFPSRVIFIAVDNHNKKEHLKTEVSILSSSLGDYDVACDYIQFEAAGHAQKRLPFVVLPHILPDLPVYLIWAEDPCQEDPLFQSLSKLANRLIFDSEATTNLSSFANSILGDYTATGIDIADLNWARIESWRALFSMVFYTKESLEQVERAQTLSISYNAKGSQFFYHTQIQAIYLQAWIACQLDWAFQSIRLEKEEILFSYKSNVTDVEIRLKAMHEPQLPPGLISDIEIVTLEKNHFSFTRDKKQIHHMCFKSANAQKCELPAHYVLQKAESGHSLIKEITHRGTSKHFLKVLHLLKTVKI